MGFVSALQQISSQIRKSNISAQLHESNELLEQSAMERSRYEEQPPLINTQPDPLSQEEEEAKAVKPVLDLSSIKPPHSSSKGKKGLKTGIREGDLDQLGQTDLHFNKEYDYDPTKSFEEQKVHS